jgi:type IV pilus assembly protein PilQ
MKSVANRRAPPIVAMLVCAALRGWSAEPADTTKLWLDVKDVDIRDVIQMISKAHNLNIVLDNDVSGTVTLHLSDAPAMEGLMALAKSRGLELTREGSVYRIGKAGVDKRGEVTFDHGRLTIDVLNMNITDFLNAVSTQASINVVADNQVSGPVSGKLFKVPLDEGLTALLEGNGFRIYKRKNIYQVSKPGAPAGNNQTSQISSGANFHVEYANGLLSLVAIKVNLYDVITAIAQQAELEIIFYTTDIAGTMVNATLNDVPISEIFALLFGGTPYTYVQNDNIIIIGDRNTGTFSGQALSKSELIELHCIKADEVLKFIPRNIPESTIRVVKEQNALLVSGTSEEIVRTRLFLNSIDIPTPQVVVNAIVVEYSRDNSLDVGLEWGNDPSKSKGSSSYGFPSLQYNRNGENAQNFLDGLGIFDQNFVKKLPANFYLSLRALESKGKAKVLAQPSITVLNGNKASIDVGQTQYFEILGGTDQNPTRSFQPISFGIQLDITPWISSSGQITTEISPQISNAMGVNAKGYPNIFKRSMSTTVRLEDGETLILGGLLRTEEQIQHSQVPILGDIPILGYLFKTTRKTNVETNLVIYITPRIIYKEDYVSLREELARFDRNSKKIFSPSFSNALINPAPQNADAKSAAPDSVKRSVAGPSSGITIKTDTVQVKTDMLQSR